MNFFTPVQLRVLKTSWIPAVAAALFSLALTSIPAESITNILGNFTFLSWPALLVSIFTLFRTCWEGVIKRDIRQVLILAAVVICTTIVNMLLVGFMFKNRTDSFSGDVIMYVNTFAMLLITTITRFYLNDMGDKLNAALVATVIYAVMPRTGLPLSSLPIGSLGLTSLQQEILTTIISLLANICTIIAYYVIIFFVENSFKWAPFFIKLQSRIQIVDKWEYVFVFIAIWFAYMGCIGDVAAIMLNFFQDTPLRTTDVFFFILRLLLLVLMMYSIAGFLRNIITGRMLTTGGYNPWLFILHYIPVINIGVLYKLFSTPDNAGSQEEHAVMYLDADRAYARQLIIYSGIAVTLFNIYVLLTAPTGLKLSVIALVGIFYLLKILGYAKLNSGKSWLVLVIVLNAVTILFANNDYVILSLSLLYLYYYIVQEIFYPALQLEDTIKIQEPGAGDIFTHTA